MTRCEWCSQQRDWMSTAEAADFLGVSRTVFRKHCRLGHIPGVELVYRSRGDTRGEYRIPASVVSALAGTAASIESSTFEETKS
jgi:ribosomal protein S14